MLAPVFLDCEIKFYKWCFFLLQMFYIIIIIIFARSEAAG